jgi:hypothetical protein
MPDTIILDSCIIAAIFLPETITVKQLMQQRIIRTLQSTWHILKLHVFRGNVLYRGK